MDKNQKIEKLGITKDQHIENVGYLADLETIRINQFHVLQLWKQKAGSLDTNSEVLYTDFFDPGWIYVITHISAIEEGTGTPQIKIGYYDGAIYHVVESATVGNAEDSVEYVGQIFLKEHDRIYVEFEGAIAGDTAKLFINGYKIKR